MKISIENLLKQILSQDASLDKKTLVDAWIVLNNTFSQLS